MKGIINQIQHAQMSSANPMIMALYLMATKCFLMKWSKWRQSELGIHKPKAPEIKAFNPRYSQNLGIDKHRDFWNFPQYEQLNSKKKTHSLHYLWPPPTFYSYLLLSYSFVLITSISSFLHIHSMDDVFLCLLPPSLSSYTVITVWVIRI